MHIKECGTAPYWQIVAVTKNRLSPVIWCALCVKSLSRVRLSVTPDCSPPGSSVHGDPPGKNTREGCHALLQGIFPSQGSNPGLLHAGRFFTIWATREALPWSWGVSNLLLVTDAEAEAPTLWPPDVKSWLIGKDPDIRKDWGQEEKGTTDDEMVGWHHWLNEHEFEQTPGDSGGQGSLECCSSWGCKESDMI